MVKRKSKMLTEAEREITGPAVIPPESMTEEAKRTRATPKAWAESKGYGADYYGLLKAGDIAAIADHLRLGSVADAQAKWDADTARAEGIVSSARARKDAAEAAEKRASAVLVKLASLKATAEA